MGFFDKLFGPPNIDELREAISPFVVKITDVNCKEKAEEFLKTIESFKKVIPEIQKIIEFI